MLDAEISANGTVLVEGHHVGELQGFRFTADQSAGGEDAKAVRAAAQKALAAEFEARAERFSASGNGDIALGSDGTLRWIGAPIGTLVAGEDALKPRVVLLADEQLTGAARDKVAARAERFVNFQVEQFLKPLVDLKAAEQLSGIARGIAFQLSESFGLINRRDIAEEMRSLDQEGRAALRRLGVRFGAYHVFVPSLVKPAPAGLVTLLWALKNDGKDKPGFGDVVNALATGRTSVVVDPAFDKAFYRLAGFRNLGRRAVRVDILERLADLIRPATNWKPGLGPRPDGAYDGQSFTVTPAMMSILGATADDMEEILKGLGYRSEAKPAEEVKARLEVIDEAAREAAAAKAAAEAAKAAQAAAAEPATESVSETETTGVGEASHEAEAATAGGETTDTEGAVPSAVESVDEAAGSKPSSPLEGEVTPQAAEGVAEAGSDAPFAEQPAVSDQALNNEDAGAVEGMPPDWTSSGHPPLEGEGNGGTTATAVATAGEAASAGAPGAEAAEEEAPKPILLWRQARFEHRRGGQRHDQRQRGGARHGGEAAGGQGRAARENAREDGRPRFKGNSGGNPGGGPGGKPGGRQAEGKGRREGRPEWKGGRQDGKDRNGGGQGKPGLRDRREERPARIDPDSPFAKLAALRDQLKK